MTYKQTIRVKPTRLNKIRHYLEVQPTDEAECLSEDEVFTETAIFENGITMDIKCCGVQYQEGESNLAWTEAVLFRNGSELTHSDVESEFEGDWELNYGNDKYIVHVIPA